MTPLLTLAANLLPQLVQYFTKNKGLNTVTGGGLGALLTLLVMGFQQTGAIDQTISFLQNQGEYGLIAGAIVAGLRVAVLAYTAAKK